MPPRLSKGFMSEDAKGLERRRFPTPSSLLFLTAGALTCKVTNTTAGPAGSLGTHHASTTGEQSGLLSSTLKWRHPSDCCGLALGMLPDHSLGNWHWEGGSERERSGWGEEEEEKGGQGNTVIRSEETVAQINSEACPPSPSRPTCYFWSTLNKHPRKDTKGHLSCTLIIPLEMTGELKPPNRCRHPSALGLLVRPTFFFPSLQSTCYITRI